MLCLYCAYIQSNIKAIDITKMLCYTIITEGRKAERKEVKRIRNYLETLPKQNVKANQATG